MSDRPDERNLERARTARSVLRLFMAGIIVGVLLFEALNVRLPLLTVYPGPAPDISELVQVDAPVTESKGSFHLTTVTLYEATVVEAVRGWISTRARVISRSAIYPPGKSEEDVDAETAAQMSESQYTASVAALKELGYELPADGVLVKATLKGMPAEGKLQPGDVITAVDGKRVVTRQDLSNLLGARKITDKVTIAFRRGGEHKEVTLATTKSTEAPERPVIGVVLLQDFAFPFRVSIKADDIGGPSAGLMFALAVVDILDPADLTSGKVIAGTGTIDVAGGVGRVGGVEQKILGAKCALKKKSGKSTKCVAASIFFVPQDELEEAKAAADEKVQVVGVKTLHEAVEFLRGLAKAG